MKVLSAVIVMFMTFTLSGCGDKKVNLVCSSGGAENITVEFSAVLDGSKPETFKILGAFDDMTVDMLKDMPTESIQYVINEKNISLVTYKNFSKDTRRQFWLEISRSNMAFTFQSSYFDDTRGVNLNNQVKINGMCKESKSI